MPEEEAELHSSGSVRLSDVRPCESGSTLQVRSADDESEERRLIGQDPLDPQPLRASDQGIGSTLQVRSADDESEERRLIGQDPLDPQPLRASDQGIDWTSSKFSLRQLMRFMGPGFLMCIAYIDPGNLESDLLAGVRYGYSLLWVLLWATIAGLFIQVMAVRLALATGMHLAQACRIEYPCRIRIPLWLITEAAIVCSDIPEVIGTAFALKLLFGLALWAGVLITGLSTMLFLVLNPRRLELVIAAMVGIIGICFIVEMFLAHDDFSAIFKGLLIPRVEDAGAAYLAVSLVGAVVMPHNLYLHSGSVLTRGITPPPGEAPARVAIRYNTIESAISLFVSLFINVATVAVAAATISEVDKELQLRLESEPLQNAPHLLRKVLGPAAETAFAIALLASGQSSTMTGTYAGQFVMEGFVELKMKPIYRALLTRSLAIVPSLACALIAGESGSEELIVISSVILSFQLPFAVLPLIKFVGSKGVMGDMAASRWTMFAAWVIAAVIIAANVFLVVILAVESKLVNSSIAGVFAGLLFSILGIIYLGAVGYLAARPVSQRLHGPPGKRTLIPPASQQMEDIELQERNELQMNKSHQSGADFSITDESRSSMTMTDHPSR